MIKTPLILSFLTIFTINLSTCQTSYSSELTNLQEFKNNFLDFRIYLCTGIFFRNKDKHEPAYRKIKEAYPSASEGADAVTVSQKFMLANIYSCLKLTQKYEPEKFYFKIREFAAPGKNIISHDDIKNTLNLRLID
jgi:hypothetical protein